MMASHGLILAPLYHGAMYEAARAAGRAWGKG